MEPGQAAPAAGGYGELALTALLVLAVVCVVVVVAARYAGRWLRGGGGEEGLVRVRARVPLEPRRALYLIEVGQQTLLIGSGENGIHVVTELEPGEIPSAPGRASLSSMATQAFVQRWRARKGREAISPEDDEDKLS